MTRKELKELAKLTDAQLGEMHVAPRVAWEAHVRQANAADAKVEALRQELADARRQVEAAQNLSPSLGDDNDLR